MTETTAPRPPDDQAGRKPRRLKVLPPRFAPDPDTSVKPDSRCNARTHAPDHHLCDAVAGAGTDHKGTGRCKLHGGKSPSGPLNHNWKDGKNSRAMVRLRSVMRAIRSDEQRDRIAEAIADPQLLELREEVAILRVFRDEALARLGSQESGAAWHAVRSAARVLGRALQDAVMTQAMTDALGALDKVIQEGAGYFAQQQDVIAIAHHRARLVESERQRLVQEQQVLTLQQAQALMALWEGAIRKHVNDPQVLAAIADDIERDTGARLGGAAPLVQ